MAVTIYHNPRCSKSRETLALLQANGVTPRVVEYLTSPPTVAELKKILKALGLAARNLVRKKEAAEAGVDPQSLTEDEIIAAMQKHPVIIERPIVVNGARAALGRPPERVLDIL